MTDDAKRNNKRQKRSIEDDLICPITLDLPFDPVSAEDGRIYERWAIEKHLKNSGGGAIHSPYTSEPMGGRLFPAPQIKSHIEFLLEKEFITGDLAEKWREREKEKKEKDDLMDRANKGEVKAMETVAASCLFGRAGFQKDPAKAFQWCEKAHKLGSVRGTARLGEMLIKGTVGNRNKEKGFAFLGMAAERGSDLAAFLLGMSFGYGWYGMSVDEEEALLWLQKAVSGQCDVQSLGSSGKKKAQQALEDLTAREDEHPL